MPKAGLSVQLGFGKVPVRLRKNASPASDPAGWERHGKPADLSDEQIAELRKPADAKLFPTNTPRARQGARDRVLVSLWN